jgi:collagen type III alpha
MGDIGPILKRVIVQASITPNPSTAAWRLKTMSQATLTPPDAGDAAHDGADEGTHTGRLGVQLDQLLGQTAAGLWRVEFLTQLGSWLAVTAATVVAFVLVDHWLFPLGRVARVVCWLGLVVGAAVWLGRRVLPLLGRTISPQFAARHIERQLPELNNGLINWLQLTQQERSAPRGILAAVGRHAQRLVVGREAQHWISSTGVLVRLGIVLMVALLGGLYLAVAPKSGWQSLRRLAFPWAAIAPPARVHFTLVEPGDSQVSEGSAVRIVAELSGLRLAEPVRLHWQPREGSSDGQTAVMPAEIDGVRYRLDLGGPAGSDLSGGSPLPASGVRESFRYWLEAGDATAGPFDVVVHPRPVLTIDRLEYTFPAYTRLAPRQMSEHGNIEAPEGTRVRLVLSSSQSLEKGWIEFGPQLEAGRFVSSLRRQSLVGSQRRWEAQWRLVTERDSGETEPQRYTLRGLDARGDDNRQPVVYAIRTLPDLPPEVRWEAPSGDPDEVADSGFVRLQARAIDPDYGLRRLDALIYRDGTMLGRRTLIEAEEGAIGVQRAALDLVPSAIGATAGDRLEVVLEAFDNRHGAISDLWEPNVVRSQARWLQVVAAAEEPDPSPDQELPPEGTEASGEAGEPPATSPPDDKRSQQDSRETPASGSPAEQANGEAAADQPGGGVGSDGTGEVGEQPPGAAQSGGSGESAGEQDSTGTGAPNGDRSSADGSQTDATGESGDSSGSQPSATTERGEGRAGADSSGQDTSEEGDGETLDGPPADQRDEPLHDGEAFEAIERFLRDQQSDAAQSAGDSKGGMEQPTPDSGTDQGQPPIEKTGGDSAGEPGQEPGEDTAGEQSPSAGDPATGDPATGDPATGDPATGDPATGDPATGDPGTGDPGTGEPATGEPATGDPGTGDPATGDPATGDPGTGEPATGDPATGDPATGDPATGILRSCDG